MEDQNFVMNKIKTIQSPDDVAMLMESMWVRHTLKLPQSPNNVFMVDLPPLTDKEKAEIYPKYDSDGEGVDYWIV